MSINEKDKEKADQLVDTWIGRYRRGSLRFFILHLLLYKHQKFHNQKPSEHDKHVFHGYMLKNAIKNVTKGKWQPTTASIYPILKELAKEEVIARIPDSEITQDESSRPIKQYQLTSFGILVAQGLEQARKEFAKDFIIKGTGKHHPPPPLLRGLSKEELLETFNESSLESLEDFRNHLEKQLQHDQKILQQVEKEIKFKKNGST